MDGQKQHRCALCERHQKLETVDGTAFWIEWGEDEKPRLCMDTRTHGGGLNVLCVSFCPLCGRNVENDSEQEEQYEPEEQNTSVLREEHRPAGPTEVSAR
ncbi:MAG: hypothetical protein E7440_01605 [Ruminococcaceae bacterium]|nr:hypothetical protein [Oscillospiraceae bacterium]